jgi:hypothetical protein
LNFFDSTLYCPGLFSLDTAFYLGLFPKFENMKRFLALLFTATPFILFAQSGAEMKTSPVLHFPKTGVVNVSEIKEDYFPHLQHLEMPKPGANAYNDYLQQIKSQIKPKVDATGFRGQRDAIASPTIGRQFSGSSTSGAPNDNDMAVSNNGYVVSVINTAIYFYNDSGRLLKNLSLQAFGDSLKLPGGISDPRALYDPLEDRFIVAYFSGSNDSTSNIILAFSQTNDPTGRWNFYSLPGDPLGDTTWSDYPIIALTQDELLLTINALQNDKSWQLGFRQSYIWRIDKFDGYAGTAIDTRLHSGIKYNGTALRNLCPVQGGSKPVGGTKYFLSNRNFALESDTIFMITLGGNISDPSPSLAIKVLKSESQKYGVPPTARQPATHTLETNDARILDAFMENGTVQFVGNSVVKSTGLAGIFHGTISTFTAVPHLKITILGDKKLDYGYPAIAYAGNTTADDDALIFVNHSSDSVNAGNSAIMYKAGTYSSLQTLKTGNSYVNIISGKTERWGDYSGGQRKYNEPGVVWVAGSYGYKKNQFERVNGTWISEIKNPLIFPASVMKTNLPQFVVGLYPSPVLNYSPITVEFEAQSTGYADFRIYDMSGREVHHLLTQKMKAGKNRFTFIPNPLKAGIYILKINQLGSEVAEKKFVVQ